MSSNFELGRYAVNDLMIHLAGETGTFNRGYAAGARAQGISGPFMTVIDGKSADGEDDSDGYDAGFEAAHETFRQLATRSAQFREGWTYELHRPIVERMKTLATDTAVAHRADQLYVEHKFFEQLVE